MCLFLDQTYPPMPLSEFCDRFFLDLPSGCQFAEAYGMQLIQDLNRNIYVTIKVCFANASSLIGHNRMGIKNQTKESQRSGLDCRHWDF